MEDEPPDPGGKPLDILIKALESSMDTDCSESSNKNRKRAAHRSVCTLCRRKKKKYGKNKANDNLGCQCNDVTETSNNLQVSNPIEYNTPSVDQHTTMLTSFAKANEPTSNQTPRPPVGRPRYQESDAPPYIVHVQKESLANESTILHPVTFGRFLKQNNIQGIVNGSLKRLGRNRIGLSFANFEQANSFLSHEKFVNDNFKAFIPTFNVTRMGVIRGVPSDMSDEEVIANISVPIGCGPIIKIRRFKKKIFINNTTQFVNTGTIVATFDGQVLPTRVFMCYTALPVDLYIYPTIQCYNCCRYGHVKNQCRSTPRCYKCGQGHTGDSCSVDEEDYWCIMCKGYHEAINKKCLEHSRQKAIKETMSKSCISYIEATKMHPTIQKMSYADALVTEPIHPAVSNAHHQRNHSPPISLTHSYKKPLFAKPKSPPRMSKGYDQAAHSKIVRNPSLSELRSLGKPNDLKQNNNKITDTIETLIMLLSKSNIVSPSNVAAVIDALYQIENNNGSKGHSNSVELSKSHQQET